MERRAGAVRGFQVYELLGDLWTYEEAHLRGDQGVGVGPVVGFFEFRKPIEAERRRRAEQEAREMELFLNSLPALLADSHSTKPDGGK